MTDPEIFPISSTQQLPLHCSVFFSYDPSFSVSRQRRSYDCEGLYKYARGRQNQGRSNAVSGIYQTSSG